MDTTADSVPPSPLTSHDAYLMKRHAGGLPSSSLHRRSGAIPAGREADAWRALTARISAEAESGTPGRYERADVQLLESEVLRLTRLGAAPRTGDHSERSRAERVVLLEHAEELLVVADRLRSRLARPAAPRP